MKIEGILQTCDFEDDTLTIQLPRGFWSEQNHVIRSGKVTIQTDGILPPRDKECCNCLSGLTHTESEAKDG